MDYIIEILFACHVVAKLCLSFQLTSIRVSKICFYMVVCQIITFDDYGVSGHCNHRDVNHGVK